MLYKAAFRALSPLAIWPLVASVTAIQPRADAVDWVSCGELQCANISVPLDYNNVSDTRTISVALARFVATDQANRKGSVFINPGGPGGSGTAMAVGSGKALSAVLGGQYDIVGFDPRGVNLSTPYVSCFSSLLEEATWQQRSTNTFQLNIPSNLSAFASSVEANLQYQVSLLNSELSSLAAHCYQRSGEVLAYLGAEAVVKDIDFLSKAIEGDDVPVNFWGVSYGTVLGQYLVKILPPNRVGKIIMDGVVNVDYWSDYAIDAYRNYKLNTAEVLRGFASSCIAAKDNCTLNSFNFTSPDDLLGAIGNAVDALYANPELIDNLPSPAIATASDLRYALLSFSSAMTRWPTLAGILVQVFSGNYAALANLGRLAINPDYAKVHDTGAFAAQIIFCDDTKPYDDTRPAPTTMEITQAILGHVKESPNWGSHFLSHLVYCHVWDKARLTPRRSRYGGPFELTNGSLSTPVLLVSNAVDNGTPISGAIAALNRLGDNARLLELKGAYGHVSLAVVSFCEMRVIRDYMLNGTVPSEAHSTCSINQIPFEDPPVPPILSRRAPGSEEEAKAAWMQLAKTLPTFSFYP